MLILIVFFFALFFSYVALLGLCEYIKADYTNDTNFYYVYIRAAISFALWTWFFYLMH